MHLSLSGLIFSNLFNWTQKLLCPPQKMWFMWCWHLTNQLYSAVLAFDHINEQCCRLMQISEQHPPTGIKGKLVVNDNLPPVSLASD